MSTESLRPDGAPACDDIVDLMKLCDPHDTDEVIKHLNAGAREIERLRPDAARLDALERLRAEGDSPGIISDDKARWVVTCGDTISFFVPAILWRNSLREAIDHYLDDGEGDHQAPAYSLGSAGPAAEVPHAAAISASQLRLPAIETTTLTSKDDLTLALERADIVRGFGQYMSTEQRYLYALANEVKRLTPPETPAESAYPRCACGAHEWGPNTTRITDANGRHHYPDQCEGFSPKTSGDADE